MDNEAETAPEVAPQEDKYASIVGPLREQHKGRTKEYDLEEYGYPEHGLVVVAKPSNPEVYRVYTRELRDPKLDDVTAVEKFAAACIAYPTDPAKKKAIFSDLTGFAQVVAAAGEELFGIRIKERGKA